MNMDIKVLLKLSQSNSTVYKSITHHGQVEFIPVMQDWFIFKRRSISFISAG